MNCNPLNGVENKQIQEKCEHFLKLACRLIIVEGCDGANKYIICKPW